MFKSSDGGEAGEEDPEFGGDEPGGLRLGDDLFEDIATVKVAGAAEEGFGALIVNIGALDEFLGFAIIGPAGERAGGTSVLLMSVFSV